MSQNSVVVSTTSRPTWWLVSSPFSHVYAFRSHERAEAFLWWMQESTEDGKYFRIEASFWPWGPRPSWEVMDGPDQG